MYIYGLLSDYNFNWINHKFIASQFWCNISSKEITHHKKKKKNNNNNNC